MVAVIATLAFGQNMFDKPALLKGDILVYATRAILRTREVHVGADRRVTFTETIRRSDSESKRKGTYTLTDPEWKQVQSFLKAAAWEKLVAKPKSNPMWPSCYDGADSTLIARIDGKMRVWGNDKYEGDIESSGLIQMLTSRLDKPSNAKS